MHLSQFGIEGKLLAIAMDATAICTNYNKRHLSL